jgi:prepilin-type processing-associated H-X9-DG protein
VFHCPSYPVEGDVYNYFIGARAAFVATGMAGSVDRRAIRFPSALVLSGDTSYSLFLPTDADKDDYSQNCLGFTADASHWAPHHRGGLNVLFADSHVKMYKAFDAGEMTHRYDTMSAW